MMLRFVIVFLSFLVSGAAAAQSIDYSRSQIVTVSRQMNVPVEAAFKKWNAQIAFNAEKPEASKVRIEIDMGSLDIGDPDIVENLRDRHWFDTKAHPTAVFSASSVRALGGGRFEVRGPLTMKGRMHDVTSQVTVKPAGADRIFEGAFPVKRLQYAIGDAHWRDTSVVADEVQVRFRIYQRAK